MKKNQFGEVMLRTEIMCRLCTTSKHSVLWSIHLISLLYGHFSSNMSIKYLLVWSTCQLDFPALKLYNKFMYSLLLFALQLPPILSLSLSLLLLMLGTCCWVMSTEVDPRTLEEGAPIHKKEYCIYCDWLPLLIDPYIKPWWQWILLSDITFPE